MVKLNSLFALSLLAFTSACATNQSTGNLTIRDPHERALLQVQIANSYLRENRLAEALQALAEAEKMDDHTAEIYHSRALVFYARKESQKAIESCRTALKMRTPFPEASTTLGKLLLDSGKYADAEKILKDAGENPLYSEAYKPLTSLGILYYRTGKYDQARKALDHAIELGKQDGCIAFYYRGHVNLRESKLKDAVNDYDRSTRGVCTNFGEGHLALGMALTRNGQFDKARIKFLEIQDRFPKSKLADQAMDQIRYLP